MPDQPTLSLSGPWNLDQIDRFLTSTAVPMRLAVNTGSGFPAVTPLWFFWQDGSLWAASKPDAAIVRLLRRDGRCAFDISPETPPYHGVRGRGMATVLADGLPMLRTLVERYMGSESPEFRAWLLGRSQDECAIRIEPIRLTSWNFRQRMQK